MWEARRLLALFLRSSSGTTSGVGVAGALRFLEGMPAAANGAALGPAGGAAAAPGPAAAEDAAPAAPAAAEGAGARPRSLSLARLAAAASSPNDSLLLAGSRVRGLVLRRRRRLRSV
jgi:hypothetical protein